MRQSFSVGSLLELGAGRRHAPWSPGHGLSLECDTGVELEGAMLHLQVIRLAQPVDPRLADVTPGSNEVAEDEQLGGH